MEYTPEIITKLKKNEVFVFGSNESGIHGGGAAKLALEKFGAVWGVGLGLQGQTFAIPTKDWRIDTLELDVIKVYVARFIEFTKLHPGKKFFVTKIGCGLAGWTVEDIAPLFRFVHTAENVHDNIVLPKEFSDYILTL